MVMSLEDVGSVEDRVAERLQQFQLTTAAPEMGPRLCQAGHEQALTVIAEVLDLEAEARHQRRIARLRSAAQLPPGKTWATFDATRLPVPLQQRLAELRRGEFLDRAVNVLSFGLPGVGKSHAACALGHSLIEQGRSVLFRPAYQLVQELLAAKLDFTLPRLLHKLDGFELLAVDDIGYIKQSAEEAEVLFTLISERYERRSLLVTSNLMFSEWERIFKDTMATAAAIDRLVHHACILEFTAASYRTTEAGRAPTESPSIAPPRTRRTPRSS
jgi:DNA replication protein DnaC